MTKAILGIAFPSIWAYAGKNSSRVSFGNIELWFSYETLVAYLDAVDGLVVSENRWSPTTGKHLNAIDGGHKQSRLPRMEFERKVGEMTERHSVREIETDAVPFAKWRFHG